MDGTRKGTYHGEDRTEQARVRYGGARRVMVGLPDASRKVCWRCATWGLTAAIVV